MRVEEYTALSRRLSVMSPPEELPELEKKVEAVNLDTKCMVLKESGAETESVAKAETGNEVETGAVKLVGQVG
jgi:hypothetical protein